MLWVGRLQIMKTYVQWYDKNRSIVMATTNDFGVQVNS